MAKKKAVKSKKSPPKRKESLPIDYSKPLKNPRYEQFCQAYMATNNATQAAKDAKYSDKTAYSKGNQLLKIVEIKNRLAVLQAELSEETGISIKSVAEGFRKIAFGMVTKTLTNKNKLRALENLGKNVGFYSRDNEQKADAMTRLLDRIDGQTRGLPE